MTFPRFFDAASLGSSLKEVATDLVVTTHQDVTSRWFHSSQDADLFIWLDQNQNVLKQQISFYGQVVEWNVIEGLKTGLVIEEDATEKVRGSEIIQFDDQPQRTQLCQALDLLEHITALESGERQRLAQNFEKLHGMSTTMSPIQFLERFNSFKRTNGKVSEPYPVHKAQSSLWRRLCAWFSSK